MSKTHLGIGECFPSAKRDSKLLHHLGLSLSMAGTLRKSGMPQYANQILASTIPIQLSILHHEFCGGSRQCDPTTMLKNLRDARHITEGQKDIIRLGLAGVITMDPTEIRTTVQASHLLNQMMNSPFYQERVETLKAERKVAKEAAAKARRRSPLMRWASAAAGLFAVGASS